MKISIPKFNLKHARRPEIMIYNLTVFMFYLFIVVFLLGISAHAQTVTISQEAADKCVENTQKLDQAQKLIDQFLLERQASGFALQKANAVIEIDAMLLKAKDDIIALKDRKEIAYQELIKIYENMITLYQKITDDLEKRLTKKKSGLSAFLGQVKKVLEVVIYLAAGAGIGRVL